MMLVLLFYLTIITQHLSMTLTPSLVSQLELDPKAILTNTDIARLLMDYCNNTVNKTLKEDLNEALKEERKVNNENLRHVIEGLGRHIGTLKATLHKETLAMSEKLAELELKVETTNSYLGELIYSLDCKVLDSNLQLKDHINTCSTALKPKCDLCAKTFETVSDIVAHIIAKHCPSLTNTPTCYHVGWQVPSQHHLPLHPCNPSTGQPLDTRSLSSAEAVTCAVCAKTFGNYYDLTNHIQCEHESVNHSEAAAFVRDSDYQHTACSSLYRFLCAACGDKFQTEDHLTSHMSTNHNQRGQTFQSVDIMSDHVQVNHDYGNPMTLLHCNHCEYTFHSMILLNIHIKENHGDAPDSLDKQCSSSNISTYSGRESHGSNHQQVETSSIPQFDGNITLLSDTCTIPTDMLSTGFTPSLSTPAHDTNTDTNRNLNDTAQGGDNDQLQYTLNQANQARRLLDNTERPELSIRYSSPQIIAGRQHPTNVSIDCNSGVYLTAVKPALEAISKGWEMQILGNSITCDEISPRKDMSGRKVCTKIVLYLMEATLPSSKCKVVLHFYHTSCTIQVQGSSLLKCGTCAPVWLTKHFLEPLAIAHTDQNRDAIDAMNTNIRQSAMAAITCKHCHGHINPAASHPKDQELSCSKCRSLFHKKCTDRKKSTANWKRTPWLCEDCIMGSQPLLESAVPIHLDSHFTHHSPDPPQQASHTPLARFLALNSQAQNSPQPAGSHCVEIPPRTQLQVSYNERTQQHLDKSPTEPNVLLDNPGTAPDNPGTPPDNPSAPPDNPGAIQNQDQSHPSPQTGPNQSTTPLPPARQSAQVVFPTTAHRQRSSNITLQNPEHEFQQTALSACRSTIAQQETELKTLKDGIAIRNRRILQLESIVGEASETIAARDCPNDTTETRTNNSIVTRIEKLENKLNNIQVTSPPNNIVINTCSSAHSDLKRSQSVMTQTTSPAYDCTRTSCTTGHATAREAAAVSPPSRDL